MIEQLPESDGKVLAIRMSGTVEFDDYQAMAPELAARFAKSERVRIFQDWQALDGFSPEAESDRFLFRKAVGDRIERVAIVGDQRWESERVRLDGLIRGEARLFDPAEREAAWQWLREDSET